MTCAITVKPTNVHTEPLTAAPYSSYPIMRYTNTHYCSIIAPTTKSLHFAHTMYLCISCLSQLWWNDTEGENWKNSPKICSNTTLSIINLHGLVWERTQVTLWPEVTHIHHDTGWKTQMITVHTSQNTSHTYIIKISWWRLYREIIAVYRTNHMKHKQTICGQNATFTVYPAFTRTNCYAL